MYANLGTTAEKERTAEKRIVEKPVRITQGLEDALREGSWKSTLLPLGFAFGVLIMIVAVAVLSN